MCNFYDEKSKLWKNNNSPKLNNRNLGKEILDSLRVHGSKVLQVDQMKSINVGKFFICGLIFGHLVHFSSMMTLMCTQHSTKCG